MITINKNTKIYVACPPNISTGGTELLYQLVEKLSNAGLKSFIYYFPVIRDANPIHPNFLKYRTEYVTEIEDSKNHLLIIPEIFATQFSEYVQVRKCLWWLSVDNFFVNFYSNSRLLRLFTLIGLRNYYKRSVIKSRTKGFTYHLVQSHYAATCLKENGIDFEYLSDYLNSSFLSTIENSNQVRRKNQVIYNPKKGLKFTKKIIAATKDNIKWVPILNMTPNEVKALLAESKLYIDFGNHPGKDRIPREAAILGCCILTGRRGAASNDEDIPIAAKYKIEDKRSNLTVISSMIDFIMNNYSTCKEDFDHYVEKIKAEEKRFESDLKKIFVKSEEANLYIDGKENVKALK